MSLWKQAVSIDVLHAIHVDTAPYVDAGASEAFAVCDHQVAHVYVRNPGRVAEVRELLGALPGVEAVHDVGEDDGAATQQSGHGHPLRRAVHERRQRQHH